MAVRFFRTSTISQGLQIKSKIWDGVATNRLSANLLLIGGGGGAGGLGGGGGGGGVIPDQSAEFTFGISYSISIGAAGASVSANDLSTNGGAGGSTSIETALGTYTAVSGGGGLPYGGTPSGNNGGSGGGGSAGLTGGTGTALQGNNGGGQTTGSDITASGGGGYGSTGSTGSTTAGGNGGQGYLLPADIQALPPFSGMTYVGSGGGGGCRGSLPGGAGTGGTGAGNGSKGNVVPGSATSFGSGGGGPAQAGASQPWQASGLGKSGVITIKYVSSLPVATSTTGSPNVTVSGGFRYYTFTSDGSITFNGN